MCPWHYGNHSVWDVYICVFLSKTLFLQLSKAGLYHAPFTGVEGDRQNIYITHFCDWLLSGRADLVLSEFKAYTFYPLIDSFIPLWRLTLIRSHLFWP
jgi:hypothetical protein